jgi:ATP-dependent Lon protease
MANQLFGDIDEFDNWLAEGFDPPSDEHENDELPVVPLRDTVVYPHMMAPLLVGRERSILAVEAAMARDQRIIVVAQRDDEIQDPDVEDLYTTGTEVIIGRRLRMPDGTISIWVQGQHRVQVIHYTQTQPYIAAEAIPLTEHCEMDLTTEALMRAVLALFEKIVQLSRNIPEDAYLAAMNAEGPGLLADLVASVLTVSVQERQELLEIEDCTRRLQQVSVMLAAELDVLELENRIQSQIQDEIDHNQREYFLREQMRVIQNELGRPTPTSKS